ncbi:MAG: glycosyltransferase [Acidimicrobiia bacterium]
MIPQSPAVSVVVPTRDRPGALVECLEALARQTASSFDVVVVDDASRDAHAVAEVVERFPNVRVVRGEGRGPAAARNLGAMESNAPVVCFTDDDCRPAPSWIATIQDAFADGATVVAGSTVAVDGHTCAVASQLITNHLVDWSRTADGSSVGFAPSCNVACTRAAFTVVPFDEHYPLAAGEDREWCTRVTAAGMTITFAPDAAVLHDPDTTVGAFWRQQVRYGRGAHQFHRSIASTERIPPAAFYRGLARTALHHGPAIAGLVAVAQVATAIGYAQAALAAR